MGRPKKGIRTVPARLTEEAARWAKIASAYTGETLVDYVSRIVTERSREDVERYHAEVTRPSDPAPEGRALDSGSPPKPRRPKGGG